VDAEHLEPGDVLREADGDLVEVGRVHLYEAGDQTVYNLTVASTHTYHAGAALVLVHNCVDPKVPFNRRQHYGGSQTNSPAAREVREAAEGHACPSCGAPMRSGTKHAPSPQHEPPLFHHFERYGGRQMTQQQRRDYARSGESLSGAVCRLCQNREGARLAAESRRLRAKMRSLFD
jgi:hypothetical protein